MSDAKIINIRHPSFGHMLDKWHKWRLVYEGGDCFTDEFLEKFSQRENNIEFNRRKRLAPSPSFAKAALNDIKNSISQRLCDVVRRGGSKAYQTAIEGLLGGVDLNGSSMNAFINTQVLTELLPLAKVGIFIDMPPLRGVNLRESNNVHPYMYIYRAEEIHSWAFRRDQPNELSSVLLTDYIDHCHIENGLPDGQFCRHRLLWINEETGKVNVRFFDEECNDIDLDGNATDGGPIELDLDIIPLVILELNDSLLTDVANHQIALLNLESGDINYTLQANYAFYTEQQDERTASSHLRSTAAGDEGTSNEANASKEQEIKVGPVQGRRYGKELDRPGFIHPSPEPLMASIEKQKNLKEDIRSLINLSLSNIKPKMASAESKALDDRGLESGLSHIGLVLEHAERRITEIWAMYEKTVNSALIKYPKKYSLQTDSDRRADAKQLKELHSAVPSITFQKAISKEIATHLLGPKISIEEMDKINVEIDNGLSFTAEPEVIFDAVERGLLDLETAAQILGLPKETVEAAKKDHAERLARINEAQSAKDSRGVPDLSANPGDEAREEKTESRNTVTDDIVKEKTRE